MRRFQIRQLLLAQLLISRVNLLPADPQRFTGTSVKLLTILLQSRVPASPDLTNNPRHGLPQIPVIFLASNLCFFYNLDHTFCLSVRFFIFSKYSTFAI